MGRLEQSSGVGLQVEPNGNTPFHRACPIGDESHHLYVPIGDNKADVVNVGFVGGNGDQLLGGICRQIGDYEWFVLCHPSAGNGFACVAGDVADEEKVTCWHNLVTICVVGHLDG